MYLSNSISTVISNLCVPVPCNVYPEFTSPHWNRAWLIFPALLINIRCHIVTVNTMANGNYGRIMNNFMGELPSPLGNTVSMTDLALAVLRHICLIACVWLTHSLWHIWMFHSVNYRELVKGENRFVQGFVWACVQLCRTVYMSACIYKHAWMCMCMCIYLQHVCRCHCICIQICVSAQVCMCGSVIVLFTNDCFKGNVCVCMCVKGWKRGNEPEVWQNWHDFFINFPKLLFSIT